MMLRPVSELKLLGGDVVLDFVNSVDDRGSPDEQDFISTYADLVRWCGHAGLLDPADVEALCQWGLAHAEEADRIARDAVDLRGAVRGLLDGNRNGESPKVADLTTVNRLLPSRSEIDFSGTAYVLRQREAAGAEPVRRLALRTVHLLTSDLLRQVRCCEGDRCEWYFLDRSRSRPRRWCSMTGCGNRAKGRRHAAREKAKRHESA